jgi:hypothetical protein
MPSREIVERVTYKRKRKRVFMPRDVGRLARMLIDQPGQSPYADWDEQDICDELRRRGIDCCKGKDKCAEAAYALAKKALPIIGGVVAAIVAIVPVARGAGVVAKVVARIPGAAKAVLGIVTAVEGIVSKIDSIREVIALSKTVVECYQQDQRRKGR